MNGPLALIVSSVFAVLAVWHFYMAVRPSSGKTGAVPSVDGKPLFVPTRAATVAVGVALVLCAALVAATGGVLSVGLPPVVLAGLSYALAAALLARAVGEFRYVGFGLCRIYSGSVWPAAAMHFANNASLLYLLRKGYDAVPVAPALTTLQLQ